MRSPLLIISLLLLSCGGNDGDLTAPDTGTLEIRASTSGEAGADYMVRVDGEPGGTLTPNGALTVSDLESGFHTVEIVAPPPGCTVTGDNPRTVSVATGSTSVETFVVNCVPLLGSIQVTTATTGSGPASYDLVMDGTAIGPVGASASRTIENVPPGLHSIELGNVPAGCQVQGTLSQVVTVQPSSSAAVTFSVTCSPPPAEAGTLNVTVSTSGPDADPDGYQVVVDGGTPQPIGVTATITLTSLAAGDHSVRLDGVAANCSVSGPNPQTVSVSANGTATVTFAATCAALQPTTGRLRITTATSGSDVDSDGYLVTINDQEPVEIGVDDELSLDLEPGTYTVTLSEVAGNCEVSGAEQTALVTAGTTDEVEFEITCSEESGAIRVITTTGGSEPDENGYILMLDDQERGPIDNDDEQTIPGLAPGDHILELGDVAENCEVAGENQRTVTVTAGETAETTFDITCSAVEPTGSIHVTVTTEGTPDDTEFALTLDGGDPQTIEFDGELTLREVSEGSHEVVLEVASNCTVPDDGLQTVDVTAGETAVVSYDVDCSGTSTARR